tara:strand:+ start:46 stop:432 length:387 start_codon:yes stop_codon:yes gene_type:complete
MFLLIGAFVTGSYTILQEMSDATGQEYDPGFANNFSDTINISNNINRNVNRITNISAQTQGVFIITMVPETLKLVGNMITLPFSATGNMVTALSSNLSLPTWVVAFIMALIGVLLIFAVISLILRYPS